MKRFLLVFMAIMGAALPAQAQDKDVTVVELFTSQSCSSCPPADKVLGEIAAKKNVVALSCHVTYWDHLNWKDTLSHDFCTKRQGAYASARGTTRVYTPQLVVNGAAEFNGADRRKALASLSGKVPGIDLSLKDGKLQINLPDLKNAPALSVFVFGYKKGYSQNIPSGENAGRSVYYTNSVTNLLSAGEWNGAAGTRTVEMPGEGIDGYAAIAQDNQTGKILAAGKLEP